MKNLILKSTLILSLILMTSFTVKESINDSKKIIGVWEYSVPDAPHPYQKGILTFSIIENELTGFISIEENKIDLKNVVSKKNKITCELYIEGETVKFDLNFKRKSFSGTASYSEGDLEMTGIKME
jgi:hypothetical protein